MIQCKKEAHPDTAMSERAKEPGQASRRDHASNVQFTTPPTLGQALHVADFLSRGEANALPMKHLKEMIHLPARTIRLMIRRERLDGVPILESSSSLGGGYFLPDSPDERARCVHRLRRRATEIVRVADALEAGDGY